MPKKLKATREKLRKNVRGGMKAKVSERALIQRINRKLAADGEVLKKLRGGANSPDWNNLGDYFIVDMDRNFVVSADVGLEGYGRELGVLAPWERLADEDEA